MPITLNTKVYDNVGFNSNGQFVYSEKSGGTPTSFGYLTAKVNAGTGKADSTSKWNLSLPIVATVDGPNHSAGDVIRTYYVQIHVTEPPGSTSAERTDIRLRIKSLVDTAQFIGSVVDVSQPSG